MRLARRQLPILGILVFGWFSVFASPLFAYTPESPEVRRLVDRAVKYLESPNRIYDESHRALAAMALYKAGVDPSHALIQESVQECLDICRTSESVGKILDIYGTCVVGLFLCELDPKRFESEIGNVIRSLEERQKPFGGWGYPQPHQDWKTGDTSMTQYAVLCAWLARNTGAAEISQEAVRKVTNWLIRTQNPRGAWGYQGRDPGASTFTGRVEQTEVRHSLCAAGLGSMYICSNMLGLTSADGLVVGNADVPAALKPIIKSAPLRSDSMVDQGLIRRAIRDGNKWYAANYRINPPEYTMYYLYTLERYQSFKELAEKRVPKEPRWYNDGVRFLQKQQTGEGSWRMSNGTTELADTAFGIFFLVRSTKKSIAKVNDEFDGLLVAGRGLPTNTENVRMQRGRVVTTPFQGTANALLEILNNEEHPDFESASQSNALKLSSDKKQRQLQLKRLRRLVRAETYQVRLVAVKTLSVIRDLENIPSLIYALTDPDMRVSMAARNGLRFISRKFKGMGFEEASTAEQRRQAVEGWKKWYLSLRPDAYFPE